MIACGIDLGNPGGIAVVGDVGRRIVVISAEPIPQSTSVLELQKLVYVVLERRLPDAIATERPGTWGRPGVGMAQRAKQDLIGAVCEHLKIGLVDYTPQDVKKAVTGNGLATKAQVARCVHMLVETDATDEHVLDAIAIALVAYNREPGLSPTAKPKRRGNSKRRAKPKENR